MEETTDLPGNLLAAVSVPEVGDRVQLVRLLNQAAVFVKGTNSNVNTFGTTSRHVTSSDQLANLLLHFRERTMTEDSSRRSYN